jgi:hypothetical protein
MLEGFWQYWKRHSYAENLDRGETAYDLEAGYGYYSLLMSELVGAQGRVVALEYNPWLFGLLRRNLALNGRDQTVVTHRLIIANKAAAAKELPVRLIGPSIGNTQAVQFRHFSDTSCIAMTMDGLEQGLSRSGAYFCHCAGRGGLPGHAGPDGSKPFIENHPGIRC